MLNATKNILFVETVCYKLEKLNDFSKGTAALFAVYNACMLHTETMQSGIIIILREDDQTILQSIVNDFIIRHRE